jgi:hypothetical protein
MSPKKYNIIIIILIIIVLLFILSNYTEIKSKIMNILNRADELGTKSAKLIDTVYDNFLIEGTPENPSTRDKIMIKLYELNQTISKADKLLDEIDARKLVPKADKTIMNADILLEEINTENLIKEVDSLVTDVKIAINSLKRSDSFISNQIFGDLKDRTRIEKEMLSIINRNKQKENDILQTEIELRNKLFEENINKYNQEIEYKRLENKKNRKEKINQWADSINYITPIEDIQNTINLLEQSLKQTEDKINKINEAIQTTKNIKKDKQFMEYKVPDVRQKLIEIKKNTNEFDQDKLDYYPLYPEEEKNEKKDDIKRFFFNK